MAKNIILYLAVLCTCFAAVSYGQYNTNQNKVWAFGTNAGLNFNTGSPVAITTGMNTSEGTASVSDASGNLLFYSDGDTVYNRTGARMPNGSHVTNFPFGTTSTSQGAQIVPVTGNPNQYYLFSLESYMVGNKRLEYCIVDMSLDGGLGDVIASTKSTLLDTAMGEHMISVQGNHCNVWLVTHREDSTVFRVYNITAAGITGPVVSNVGTLTAFGGYSIGQFRISPDRTKLVSTGWNNGSYVALGVGTELYDFDANTGTVSNCRLLDSLDMSYGCEFSPDNTKVYTIQNTGTFGGGPTYLYQYDVTLSTAAAIRASQYTVNSTSIPVYPSMKLACDNKIYLGGMVSMPVTYLDCIANPNVSGSGCTYTSRAVNLVSGTYYVFGLPNVYVVPGSVDTSYHNQDTVVCASVGSITLTTLPGYTDYVWSNGSTGQTTTVTASGNYIANCDSGCHLTIDTCHVKFDAHIVNTKTTDTFFCAPGHFTLVAPTGFGTNKWQDGSTAPSFTDSIPGTYYVDGTGYCSDNIDTFIVTSRSLSIDLGPDATVCMNYPITVPLPGKDIKYLWQDGSTDSVYSADHTGSYYVTVTQYGCKASDTINVNFFYFSQNIPDTFICKDKPVRYSVSCNVPEGGSVMWDDGVSTPNRTFTDSGTWYVMISKDQCEILDTVRVTTGYCSCWLNVPSAFTPNGDGLNDVFRPTIQPGCPASGYVFTVLNRWGQVVFTSDMQGKGWDGTFNGQPCDIDTYMYTLTYFSGVYNTPITQNGDVTLIR